MRKRATLTLLLLGGCVVPPVSGEYTFDTVRARVQTRADQGLEDVLSQLERVPDFIQRVGNAHGTILITDKRVTQEPEATYLQGKKTSSGTSYRDVPGVYLPKKRIAIVRSNARGGSVSLALHEYGHLTDHALGYPSQTDRFKRIHAEYKNPDSLSLGPRMRAHARSDPGEFFADCFASYYYSDYERGHLQQRFPKAYEFFRRLERAIRSRQRRERR